MKFRYGYRTRENEKVEGVVSASSREEAYAKLRREGKKPYMVEPLPGLLNRLSGVSKRWLAIVALCALCLALGFSLFLLQGERRAAQGADEVFDSMIRRQVIGDAAIIEEGIRTGWEKVFALEGERFLASFAIPGVAAAVRSTTEEEILKALDPRAQGTRDKTRDANHNAPDIEARQIKAMVEGLKLELREFLADGGTIKQYGRRLVQRQEEELTYYRRAKTELDHAIAAKRSPMEIAALAERLNTSLRKIGVKPLVIPNVEE